MKSVFVVIEERGYDGIDIVGIYSTKDNACCSARLMNEIDGENTSDYRVVEYNLDTVSPNLRAYFDSRISEYKTQIERLESLL